MENYSFQSRGSRKIELTCQHPSSSIFPHNLTVNSWNVLLIASKLYVFFLNHEFIALCNSVLILTCFYSSFCCFLTFLQCSLLNFHSNLFWILYRHRILEFSLSYGFTFYFFLKINQLLFHIFLFYPPFWFFDFEVLMLCVFLYLQWFIWG